LRRLKNFFSFLKKTLDIYHGMIYNILQRDISHHYTVKEGFTLSLEKLCKRFIPMSETMFYILSSLTTERHGYGIMLHVQELTNGRITLGAGTIYQTLSKLEKEHLIRPTREIDRKKEYLITDDGRAVLTLEARRICELSQIAKEFLR
jgi:DNA-binding PadR family transcriptional regulator